MPTIPKRGQTWQAQVRRAGYPALSKSFATRADALAWAREKERSIDRAELPTDIKELRKLTVADLLKRYEQEITPRKRGALFERSRIRQLMAHRMSQTSLSNLAAATVTHYRDDRLKVVKPPSVRRELVVLRHVFEVASRDWGLPIREPREADTTAAGCQSKGAPFARRGRGPAPCGHRRAFSLVSAPIHHSTCRDRDAPWRTPFNPVARHRFRQQHRANSQHEERPSSSYSAHAKGDKNVAVPAEERRQVVSYSG